MVDNMTTKYNICEDCNVREAEYTIFDHINNQYDVLCHQCYDTRFYDIADEGIGYFMDWALANYGKEYAWNIAYQLYGHDKVNEYKSTVGLAGEEMITMFTYGILKYPDNIKREGGENIVENCTVAGHKMYLYNFSFPVTEQTGSNGDKIYGTLFQVPKSQVLYSYDATEGYDPRQPKYKNMYNREVVKVKKPNGEIVDANMYIANPIWFRKEFTVENYIPTGNFDDADSRHRRHKKNKVKK